MTGPDTARARYRFGDFVLDAGERRLSRLGTPVKLGRLSYRFLLHLVERSQRLVTHQELADAVWGRRPVTPETVAQRVKLVRKALGDDSAGPRFIESVRGEGYRFIAMAERIEPGGANTAEGAVRSPALHTARRWPRRAAGWGFGAAILVVLSMAFVDRGIAPPPLAENPPGRLVRVAPLTLTAGAIDPSIRSVAAATFVEALDSYGIPTVVGNGAEAKGSEPALALLSTLHGDEFRPAVNVRLVDAHTEQTIWSRRFEQTGSSASAVVEQAAFQAAYAIECGFLRRDLIHRPLGSELLGMWVRGCDLAVRQQRVEAWENALAILRRAPDDAASHSNVAMTAARLAQGRGTLADNTELLARAFAAANRALAIDPTSAEALLALSHVLPYGAWAEKEALILEALAADAGYRATRGEYSRFLRRVGRLEEALHYAQRTTSLMRGASHLADKAWLLALVGRRGEALATLGEAERRWPHDRIAPMRRFELHAFSGDPQVAMNMLQGAPANSRVRELGGRRCWTPLLKARLGAVPLDRRAMESACSRETNHVLTRSLSGTGDGAGAIERILALLDDWERNGHSDITMHLFYPEMAAARRDPRFMTVAARTRLADYWLATGRWPDYCERDDLPYDCEDAARAALGVSPPAASRPVR